MSKVLAETLVITRDDIGELAWAMSCLRNLLTFLTLPFCGEIVLRLVEFDFLATNDRTSKVMNERVKSSSGISDFTTVAEDVLD